MEKKYIFFEYFQNEKNEMETHPIYEMSEEEFIKIAPANAKVFEVYRFEELFAMLADNFFAFNNVVTSYADKARLQSMIGSNYFQKRMDVNRAALNFFSTLFMYRDFVKERIKEKNILDFFQNNRKFVRCLVMRNYIQHVESFPINLSTSSNMCDIKLISTSVYFQVMASDLKEEHMNSDTRNKFHDFFAMDEKIDLYEIINQGMGEIQLIHKKIREMPLYSVEYKEYRDFILDVTKNIAKTNPNSTAPHFYFESDDNSQTWKSIFIATDTIRFIDDNIKCYPCQHSNANNFITTAPQEFLKKCSDKIFSPAINEKLKKEAKEKSEGDEDA